MPMFKAEGVYLLSTPLQAKYSLSYIITLLFNIINNNQETCKRDSPPGLELQALLGYQPSRYTPEHIWSNSPDVLHPENVPVHSSTLRKVLEVRTCVMLMLCMWEKVQVAYMVLIPLQMRVKRLVP